MKNIILLLGLVTLSYYCVAQTDKQNFNTDSVEVSSKVEFFTFNGPYGTENNISKPAIKFIVTVKNNGTQPIPDLAVSNRSLYLNFYVDGAKRNPVSMYNGIEATGNHMLSNGQSDSYTWWVFTEGAYADVFTVKLDYCGKFSDDKKVDTKNQSLY